MRAKLAILWITIIVAGGAAAASWRLDAFSQEGQLKSRALAPGGPMAFETRHGTIITDSTRKARWADERLQKAAASFVRIFGVNPGRGVIVEMPFVPYVKVIPKARRRWTLPWMSRYFGPGDRANAEPGAHHFDNDSGIQHELNHLFFTASIIPSTKRFQYGGDAPDWLDEAAAMSAESPEVKVRRRADFHEQVCAGRLVPLERFVGQQHPLLISSAMQKFIVERRATAKGAPVMMTIGEKQLDLPRYALADFYAQSNAVAEFLADASGDPKVLGRIARSLKASTNQPIARRQRWIEDITGSDDQLLGTRFTTWARASARVGKPDCAALASNS